MTRRSLSTLYRSEVRRDGVGDGVDAEQMLALATGGDVDSTVLERLARTPDAPALRRIARSISPWSTALAADLRRNRLGETAAMPPRARKLAWASLAAAASLAVILVGLGSRGEPDAHNPAFAGTDTAAAQNAEADMLFVDSEPGLIAAALEVENESIFADSLDM